MQRHFLFFLVLCSFFVTFTASVQAVTCPTGFNDNTGAGVCIPTQTGLSQASVEYLLGNFMNWLLAILGFIGIIAFVISGIQYLTAAGDDDLLSTAKRNMKYSIIGVIVALSGYVIIQAVSAALNGATTF